MLALEITTAGWGCPTEAWVFRGLERSDFYCAEPLPGRGEESHCPSPTMPLSHNAPLPGPSVHLFIHVSDFFFGDPILLCSLG